MSDALMQPYSQSTGGVSPARASRPEGVSWKL
jgi:hypothetical protein